MGFSNANLDVAARSSLQQAAALAARGRRWH
jgi:hypothetical protein